MTLEYFYDRICDELSGAEDYITFAMEVRAMDGNFSKQFVEMSAAELDHATRLYKMFEQYYQQAAKAFSTIPEHMTKMQKEIIDKYMTGYAKIKIMHEAYNK